MPSLGFRIRLRRNLLLGCLLPGCCAGTAIPADWVALQNGSSEVQAGSALDLSGIAMPRFSPGAGAARITPGTEVFSAGSKELRFLCATLALTPNTGGFPSHAESDRLAVMLHRQGYNAVRLHMVEAMLMAYSSKDFGFDVDGLDQLHYLIAALRKRGMYLFVDLMGSWNGAFGDVRPHRWLRGKHDVVMGSLIPGEDRAHWLELVRRLWAVRNPYTGMSTLADPAVAGVSLVNEGSTDFLLRQAPSVTLLPAFQAWLAKTHGSEAGARKALGDWPTEQKMPKAQDTTPLAASFQRFAVELQDAQVTWMRQQLAGMGYTGPVTAFNAGPGLHAMRGQQQLTYVDMHSYADHPANGNGEAGTRLNLGRLLDGRNRYLDFLAWSRAWGRPFTVSEYGQPFWNPWRWEVAPFTAAYARLQGWSMLAHYGDTFNLGRPGKGRWRQMIVPFDVGTDPTLRSGETIAAFLFGRGDVSPSPNSLSMRVEPDLAAAMPAGSLVNWNTAQMQYVTAVGVDQTAAGPKKSPNRLILPWSEDGATAPDLARRMASQGMLAREVADAVGGGRYWSSTKELLLDTRRMQMTVVTPGSVGVMGGVGSKVEGTVGAEWLAGEGAAFTSALDAPSLTQASRALTVLATDSRNSGMRFRDPEDRVVEQLGHFPVLVRDATVKLNMPAPPGNKRWRLYALDATGKRTKELMLEQGADRKATALVRLASLGDQVTPYFEWMAE